MLKKRGKMIRGLFVIASVFGSIRDLAKGLWASGKKNRWLLPLAIFLCVTGVLLVLAGTVEVLAPFIYTIF
jgi:hypothetical protein